MERHLIAAVALIVAVILLAPGLPHPGDDGFSHHRLSPDATASATATQAGGGFVGDDVALHRDGSGRFHIDAEIDGHTLSMLVDTGADTVALTEADAESLGMVVNPDDWAPIVTTASGKGMAARVHIADLRVAGRDIESINAVVVRGLDTSLLGQSVLRRLGTVSITGDTLTITQ